MNAVKTAMGADSTIAIVTGSATIAVQSLVRSTQGVGRVGLNRAEAALASLVGSDRTQQVALAEVGPQRIGEIEFGVGELVEEEVGNAQLAGGADEQVGIGHAAGGEFA